MNMLILPHRQPLPLFRPPLIGPPVSSTEWIHPKTGIVLVRIPKSEFKCGIDGDEFDNGPAHWVALSAYSIGKYEVTWKDYRRFSQATGYPMPKKPCWSNLPPVEQSRRRVQSPADEHPVTMISWFDAAAYCEWAGLRLLTECEWEFAARGLDGRRYPWGNEHARDRANVSGNGTTPVDQYPLGVSPFGVYDLLGNVFEWVADLYGEDYYSCSPRDNPKGTLTSTNRVVRGGSFRFEHGECGLSAVQRRCANPNDRADVVGFRAAF